MRISGKALTFPEIFIILLISIFISLIFNSSFTDRGIAGIGTIVF